MMKKSEPKHSEPKKSEPKHSDFRNSSLTRREAMGLLGAGAALAVAPRVAFGAEPTFRKARSFRTILKDIPPDQLTSGATLFSRHLSLAPDFLPKWMAASRAMNAARGGGRAGWSGSGLRPQLRASASPGAPPATPGSVLHAGRGFG